MPDLTHEERRRDAYYTSATVAREVVSHARGVPKVVMDPAVGDGALLRAASQRWPSAVLTGLDIDRRQLVETRVQNPQWSLGRVDMLSERSRAASAVWRGHSSRVDLMLLNPPFSYRGGRSVRIEHLGIDYGVTPASAFVGISISRLSPGGELLALMPGGVLTLEKDAKFWSSLKSTWEVETVAEFPSTAFRGTRTRSVLVAVRERESVPKGTLLDFPVPARGCVELIRGRVPVHLVETFGTEGPCAPFLHTRDLQALQSGAQLSLQAPARLATKGPFVTLPRVGRALEAHIKLISSPELIVLSDCVFALRAVDEDGLTEVWSSLVSDLDGLRAQYVGGCAPYLTVRRIRDYLASRGFCCHHVAASSEPGRVLDGQGRCAGIESGGAGAC